MVGPRLVGKWQAYTGNPEAVVARLQPHAQEVAGWIAAKAGGVGTTIVQLLLMVIVSGLLYASGETVARGVLRFLRRLAGDRGENSGILAAKAVRAVALGVIVTAVAQTVLAAAGLFLAGVPQAGLLSAIVFVLCIAQIGPILVVVPATIWLYSSGAVGRGTLLLVISIVALTLDNVLRPILIKKGATFRSCSSCPASSAESSRSGSSGSSSGPCCWRSPGRCSQRGSGTPTGLLKLSNRPGNKRRDSTRCTHHPWRLT